MIGGDSFLQSEQEVNHFFCKLIGDCSQSLKLLDFSNFSLIL